MNLTSEESEKLFVKEQQIILDKLNEFKHYPIFYDNETIEIPM